MENTEQSASTTAGENATSIDLCLHVNSEHLPIFFQLLGDGFTVNVRTDISVKELLCKQVGITEDYLEERIQTIFLNGKAVDDLDAAMVYEGSTLALSGAMPGLVGATLRRGGFFAPMRGEISHERIQPPSNESRGQVILKLFNLVAKDLGPTFLQQGIGIKGQRLRVLLESHWPAFKEGCKSSVLGGKPVETKHLLEIDWNKKSIILLVNSEQTA